MITEQQTPERRAIAGTEYARRATFTITGRVEWTLEDDFKGDIKALRSHQQELNEFCIDLPDYIGESVHELLGQSSVTVTWEDVTYE